MQDKQVKATDRITFECKVVGIPQPNITWYYNDEKIQEIPKQVLIENDEGIQRLVLENVQIDQQGVYTCFAENCLGNMQTSSQLKVISKF